MTEPVIVDSGLVVSVPLHFDLVKLPSNPGSFLSAHSSHSFYELHRLDRRWKKRKSRSCKVFTDLRLFKFANVSKFEGKLNLKIQINNQVKDRNFDYC